MLKYFYIILSFLPIYYSFKHSFKGCLIPQHPCVPERLCFWCVSDFAMMDFFFFWYILIRKTKMWIWISHLYVSWLKWLIYDSLIRILVFGTGIWLFLSLVSYLFSKFLFLLLLRLMGSWFLEMGFVCFWHSYHIYQVYFYFYFYY